MISVHLKKLRRRIELSSEEERAIRDCVAETRKVPAGRVVVRAGEQLNSSLLLLDGWLARCKDLPSGERQVTELHVQDARLERVQSCVVSLDLVDILS